MRRVVRYVVRGSRRRAHSSHASLTLRRTLRYAVLVRGPQLVEGAFIINILAEPYETVEEIMITGHVPLSESIKRLGFAQNTQIRLYGETFDLISDPIVVAENLVFVDATEQRSGHRRRLRIPLNVVRMARQSRSAVSERHGKTA
jgi:hypothetical protein